ncbi:unnamed protein product [Lactuca saligna]|uniref:PGG domain-containing protein n=1 Tax=Lactuca saligna TaxID=75948 RepID=A0AA36E6Z7_LACSI|nr:unnamed protein product [Lactuca saligna]
MIPASPPVDSNESDEMNPESTPPMGSIEDINPIRQQESETKPSASSYVSKLSFRQKLPCGDLIGNREQYIRICAPLYNAASIGDWEAAQVIFGKHKDLILVECAITENYETALHIAASAKSSKSVDKFVKNLVTMMTEKQLELTNKNDNTALCLAAAAGNVKIVMTLLEKNPALVDIPGSSGMMPLYMASLFGRSKMVNYLYDKSGQMSGNRWKDQNRSWVLQKCVEADHFDVAIKIVTYWPQLATSGIVLRVLARKTDAFKGTKPHFIMRILYPILALIHVKIGSSDQKPTDAMKLLRIMWAEIMKLPDREISSIIRGPIDPPSTSGKDKEDVQQLIAKLPDRLYKLLREEESYQKGKKLTKGLDNEELKDQPKKFSSRILFVAAEMGNTEFLIELIRQYPDLIWKMNDNGQTIFHVAVIHRHEGIYNLLHEIGSMKDMITPMKDDEGNTMLHLVGKCPKNNHNQNDSGVGLQMQRELLWFKEVEALLPPSYRERKNKNGQTPHELFMEEHKDLLSANEKWMKDTANQCLVVGALIASIAFAAAFGVPGGYDQNTGQVNLGTNHYRPLDFHTSHLIC